MSPAETVRKGACGCEIIGKRGDGSPLAECAVMGFRYYGGRCRGETVPTWSPNHPLPPGDRDDCERCNEGCDCSPGRSCPCHDS